MLDPYSIKVNLPPFPSVITPHVAVDRRGSTCSMQWTPWPLVAVANALQLSQLEQAVYGFPGVLCV